MTSAALISLQDRPKRSPFRIHPAADQNDGGDDGNQHDPEKDRVFDESSALLVLPEPFDQLQSLTHYLSSLFRILLSGCPRPVVVENSQTGCLLD
jgi:hypothetical protein